MTWKGKKIDHFSLGGQMRISERCQVCDLAFEMGLSEQEFYYRYEPMERAQLLATYRSRAKRENVVMRYPVKRKKQDSDGA